MPQLPDAATIRTNAIAAFDRLQAILDSASLEQKRELIATYIHQITTEPEWPA